MRRVLFSPRPFLFLFLPSIPCLGIAPVRDPILRGLCFYSIRNWQQWYYHHDTKKKTNLPAKYLVEVQNSQKVNLETKTRLNVISVSPFPPPPTGTMRLPAEALLLPWFRPRTFLQLHYYVEEFGSEIEGFLWMMTHSIIKVKQSNLWEKTGSADSSLVG